VLAALAWAYWTPLHAKYTTYRLTHATGSDAATWVERGVQHPFAEIRLRAIQLAMRPEVQHLEPVRPLLSDPASEVRQAALLALGSATDIVSDDELLHLLHDPDVEVKRLCRMALRGRGLRETDVQLGRLFASPQPADRLQLLSLLHDDGELDVSIWLQRLSRDPCPAVRAAAARAAGEQQVVAMQERLAEMAVADPDLTVRPIAKFHFQQLQWDRVQPAGGVSP
jgi:HEAT repeat protein